MTSLATFAGQIYPRRVPILPRGTLKARAERRRRPQFTSGYSQIAPDGEAPWPRRTFYLASDFAPGLRWQWCDKITDSPVKHHGWYADNHQDTTIRGVVFRLPHGRGFRL